jgi:transketolase
VTVVAAGITLHEAIKACEKTASDGIGVRLIDAYSVKPIDAQTICAAVQATGGRLIVAEDHYVQGGLGEAVLNALAEGGLSGAQLRFKHLAVRELPGSGKPQELLDAAGIGADSIASAIRALSS